MVLFILLYRTANVVLRSNIAENFDQATEMDPCSNHDRQVKELVTCAKIIKRVGKPSFGNLSELAGSMMSVDQGIYSRSVNARADKIGRRHPAHPDKRHARLLQLPSMNDQSMNNKDNGAETEACIEAGTPLTELRGDEARGQRKYRAAKRCATGLSIVSKHAKRLTARMDGLTMIQ